MCDLSEVKNFYRSFLGRLFIIIVALNLLLATSLIAMHYYGHMQKIDEKLKTNSEFIMSSSTKQLERHLSVFMMVEKHLAELPLEFTNQQINHVVFETLSNFPSYLSSRLYYLDEAQNASLFYSSSNESVAATSSVFNLGIKQQLKSRQLLVGIPHYNEQDSTLRLPLAYLTNLNNMPKPVLMVTEIDLKSQYNPWHYELLESNIEVLVTQKPAIKDEYWSVYHSAPQSLHGDLGIPYSKPMPPAFVEYVNKSVLSITGRTVDKYAQSDGVSIYTNKTEGIPNVRVGISYSDKLNTFVALRIHLSSIYSEINQFAAWVSGFSIIAIFISFFITRHLYRLDFIYKNKLYHQANFDPLTKLANRYFFDNTLINQQVQHLGNYTLLCIDLDNFKHINDRFGRHTGDKVLALIASRIANCCTTDALPVRTGGDEFHIVLQTSDSTDIKILAKQLLAAIKQPMELDNLNLSITASVGIYLADEKIDKQTAEVYAEIAMFEAKKLRNRYAFFNQKLAEQLHYRVDIETGLKHAIHNEELYLTYQPQLCSQTKQVKGVEVLLRWQNDKLGFVPPDKFIPIAEETGLIADIGEFVIRQAFHDYALYLQNSEISLSINVSAYQLMYTPLFDILKRYLYEFKVNPKHIILEMTESIFIEDKGAVQGLFEQLIDHGFLISLDDFGTGYSSLSQMRDYPIHELKIDRSFITHIHEKDQDAALLHQIVSIAKCHNILTVAEGVEIQQQHEIVQALGIDIEQGYLYAKPMKVKALANYLKQQALVTLAS